MGGTRTGESTNEPLHVETVCVQAREDPPTENKPLLAPIYQTAVWSLESAEQCEAVYSGDISGYIYTRESNPNHQALERVVAALEGAEEAVVFGTGMAAVTGVLTALLDAGARVAAARQLYGATARMLSQELARFGVTTDWVDMTDPESVERSLRRGARVLLVETLSNPLVEVADLPVLAELCRRHDCRLVVDATFTSPYCSRPLTQGADVVLHSITKFLGGHSDLTLGVAAGGSELMAVVRRQARLLGGAANPFESWLALRGIATFPLRMERSCANAAELARRLASHPAVRRTYYPGLPSHPQHDRARELLSSPGAMLAFDVADGPTARRVLERLRHVRFAPSLGDVATTVSYPVATSHRGLSPETWHEIGISEGTLRLSVGIDHVDDVWSDLARALA